MLAVINNGGGRIFDRLPRLAAMSGRDARTAAHAPGCALLAAGRRCGGWTISGWVAARSSIALEERDADRPLLLEVVPDERQTAGFWERW